MDWRGNRRHSYDGPERVLTDRMRRRRREISMAALVLRMDRQPDEEEHSEEIDSLRGDGASFFVHKLLSIIKNRIPIKTAYIVTYNN